MFGRNIYFWIGTSWSFKLPLPACPVSGKKESKPKINPQKPVPDLGKQKYCVITWEHTQKRGGILQCCSATMTQLSVPELRGSTRPGLLDMPFKMGVSWFHWAKIHRRVETGVLSDYNPKSSSAKDQFWFFFWVVLQLKEPVKKEIVFDFYSIFFFIILSV